MSLLAEVRAALAPALAAVSPEAAARPELLNAVKPTQDAKHGDYQANFAMPLGKLLGRKPQDVANDVVKALPAESPFQSASVAGPGFINLTFRTDWLADRVRATAADPRLGVAVVSVPRTYVIDYSGPNVAKPLHVGHLRSSIIGDALARILRHLGHTVVTDNHLGDWGTQFGILLYGYKHHLDRAAYDADPVRELARLYVEVRKLFQKKEVDDDAAPAGDPVQDACRRETAKLHAGDPENLTLWRRFMPHCFAEVQEIYDRLGVLPFDRTLGESFYNPMLAGVVEYCLAEGIAAESEGAVVVPNANGKIPRTPEEMKGEDPPALIRKRDGAYTYTTTDLATIQYRAEQFVPDAVLYVVDFRQGLHFKTLFAQARRMGHNAVEFQHVSFGSVLGEDGKPFGTRKGGVPQLSELIDEATALGLQRYEASYADRKTHGHEVPELTDAVKADIASAIGVGAMKYADLSQNRTSDYKYIPDKMLATDGNTATYMQYAYARCRAILRRGESAGFEGRDVPAVRLAEPAERALALQLLRWPDAVNAAAADLMPNALTSYLWDLAKAFSVFYENCKVVDPANPPGVQASRLVLVDLTGRTIRAALALLGIRTVERM